VRRFEGLCRAIIEAGLNDLDYTVQAMTSAIANHGRTLAPLMRKAGFRYVFLGIENILEDDLEFLRAGAKNRRRGEDGSSGNAAVTAIDYLHANKMYVVGGLIVATLRTPAIRSRPIWPSPVGTSTCRTSSTRRPIPDADDEDVPRPGLIINERLEDYDGTTAVVRTAHLESDEIEFLRWRATGGSSSSISRRPWSTRRSSGFATGSRCCGIHSGEPLSVRSWVSRTSESPSSAIERYVEPNAHTCKDESGDTRKRIVDTPEPAL